jgi:NTP pyrophosphatase (non-canonical NTP hydrolase)
MNRADEILNIAQEECAELIQMISKVRRFGIDEYHIKDQKPNRQRLAEEAGDVLCMIMLMIEEGIITQQEVEDARHNKVEKLKQWSTIFTHVDEL